MTRDEVIRMAREAGFDEWESCCLSGEDEGDRLLAVGEYPVGNMVLRFYEMVAMNAAAAEREACAKLCETGFEIKDSMQTTYTLPLAPLYAWLNLRYMKGLRQRRAER